jgi:thioredoxin
MMKKVLLSATVFMFLAAPHAGFTQNKPAAPATAKTAETKVIYLTSEEFKKKVFNYEKGGDNWKFEGKNPCIVDFYADWCRPCKMIAPIMEELAGTYKDKIVVYKVNTDKEKEVAGAFNIRSIPSLLFCPKDGKPQMIVGGHAKEDYVKMIDEILLGKKK